MDSQTQEAFRTLQTKPKNYFLTWSRCQNTETTVNTARKKNATYNGKHRTSDLWQKFQKPEKYRKCIQALKGNDYIPTLSYPTNLCGKLFCIVGYR